MRTPAPPQGVALRIQEIVQQNPGIHFRELGRAAALTSTGQLRHHIDRLCRRGYVCEVGDGRYRRYFPAGHAPDLQPHLARLSRALPRRIIRLLCTGPLTRTALRHQLGCADSTLGYQLSRMLRAGDLVQHRQGSACWYALADPERVRRVLAAQEGAVQTPLLDAAPAFQPGVMEPYILPSPQAMALEAARSAPASSPVVEATIAATLVAPAPADPAPSPQATAAPVPAVVAPTTFAALAVDGAEAAGA